jgi:peptidoglycan hydrolase-like protein with peptidoglycan-binding domain
VKKLQEALNAKGAQLDVDGKFGPKTLDAVRKFQGSNSLDVDGVAGKDTMAALNGAANQANPANPAAAGGQAPKDQPAGQTGETPGAKKVGGTEDTKWAEKLPPKLREHAQAFIDAGKKYGVDPRFLAAISMQETGGGKSSAFRNKNNAMGISGKGGPKRFESIGQSIDVMARTLAKPNGYYKGKSTIAQIGKVYAPVGAANDPGGLNRHWIPNISNNFRMFGGDPSQAVK